MRPDSLPRLWRYINLLLILIVGMGCSECSVMPYILGKLDLITRSATLYTSTISLGAWLIFKSTYKNTDCVGKSWRLCWEEPTREAKSPEVDFEWPHSQCSARSTVSFTTSCADVVSQPCPCRDSKHAVFDPLEWTTGHSSRHCTPADIDSL